MSAASQIRLVGLTGGIAAGKSTVAAMLRDLGAPVIDADRLAREVVAPGEPALAEIRAAFGDQVVGADGHLDRARLGAIVFADPARRRRLEEITHPRIAARGAEQVRALAAAGAPLAIYEAALLVETGLHRALHGLIVVAADEARQLDRLRARDGLDDAQARARLAAQFPLADKLAAADYVVRNDGPLAETRRQVAAVWADLCAGGPRRAAPAAGRP